MFEPLIGLWLLLCHWVKLDTYQDKESLEDVVELLKAQDLPLKIRVRKTPAGGQEYLLYVRDADRDLARYCTGWRPF